LLHHASNTRPKPSGSKEGLVEASMDWRYSMITLAAGADDRGPQQSGTLDALPDAAT
jgi:hypothetical protein